MRMGRPPGAFAFFTIVAVLCVQVGHVAVPKGFPCLLGHAAAFYGVQHIKTIVLLSLEVVHKDAGNIDNPAAGLGLGFLVFLSWKL